MYTIAYRMMRDEDMACDVLQEAFIQVFRDIAQFKGVATIGAWIKTIVVRNSLKALKKEQSFPPSEPMGIDEMICWPTEMMGEDLERAILDLPTGYRTVFLLIEVEGYKHKEVAKMLEISEGTSKSQLYYAKKQLQHALKEFVE